MTTSEWAKHEIELACRKDDKTDQKAFDYAKSCYDSALKAYMSLTEDGHSGYSWAVTRQILIRLMKEMPLTPITENDSEWHEAPFFNDSDTKIFQSIRMSSLFKRISPDGEITYSDNNRVVCEGPNNDRFHMGLASNLIDEIKPITLPYYPSSEPIIVFVDQKSLHNDDKTDAFFFKEYFDPATKRIEKLNKAFKEKDNALIEITVEEYNNL